MLADILLDFDIWGIFWSKFFGVFEAFVWPELLDSLVDRLNGWMLCVCLTGVFGLFLANQNKSKKFAKTVCNANDLASTIHNLKHKK